MPVPVGAEWEALPGGRLPHVKLPRPPCILGIEQLDFGRRAARNVDPGDPVVPLVARADHPLVLDTWDRTVVPVPFRRADMAIGPVLRNSFHSSTDSSSPVSE